MLFADDTGVEGPVLALLHGFGGHHRIWTGCRTKLGSVGRTIAYDLPGHAASLPLFADASPRRAAASISADLAGRVGQPVHLVGHSMGGAIAALVAATMPDSVASLTLLAPGGLGDAINEPLLRRFAEATSEAELSSCLAAMSGAGFIPSRESAAALADVRAADGQRQVLLDLCSMIAKGGRQGVIPTALLQAIRAPVTLVWGDADPVLTSPRADLLPSNFELVVLPRRGHMLPEECPDVTAELLRGRLG